MAKIWKYTLSPSVKTYAMPRGAQILHADEQRGDVCIWALVNPLAEKEPRKISIYGTGHDIPVGVNHKYIGTVKLHGGSLIFHVFEEL